MAENSKIEWTDHTLNFWEGCQKVSPACDHCYAEARDKRFHDGVHWGPGAPRKRTAPSTWAKARKWNREAERLGVRYRVFSNSLADFFDNAIDPQWRADAWGTIRETPYLNWQLLTKRIGNASDMLPDDWGDGYPNVWLGITVVNQEEADRDIPKLLDVPSGIRFLSCEPLLGPVQLDDLCDGHKFIDALRGNWWHDNPNSGTPVSRGHERLAWVIVGGESGPNARPMHPAWARTLRAQCVDAGVPFFFKQWGEWVPGENVERQRGIVCTAKWFDEQWLFGRENLANEDGHYEDQPDLYRMGKKAAGHLLDGAAHREFPAHLRRQEPG